MGRWEALVKIVEAFIASGRPGYGLLALLVTTVASLVLAIALLVASADVPAKLFGGERGLLLSSQASR